MSIIGSYFSSNSGIITKDNMNIRLRWWVIFIESLIFSVVFKISNYIIVLVPMKGWGLINTLTIVWRKSSVYTRVEWVGLIFIKKEYYLLILKWKIIHNAITLRSFTLRTVSYNAKYMQQRLWSPTNLIILTSYG